MCFKPRNPEDRAKARERLASYHPDYRPPRQATSQPRGNPPTHEEDMRRAAERLLAVVGR